MSQAGQGALAAGVAPLPRRFHYTWRASLVAPRGGPFIWVFLLLMLMSSVGRLAEPRGLVDALLHALVAVSVLAGMVLPQRPTIEVDGEGIRAAPFGFTQAAIAWRDLRAVRRVPGDPRGAWSALLGGRAPGWMMVLSTGAPWFREVRFDAAIGEADTLARLVTAEAAARGIAVTEAPASRFGVPV